MCFLQILTKSTKIKPSTLWSIYLMLKSIKNMKHYINVAIYLKLEVVLKRKSSGLKVKISKFWLQPI
jgi:hypothetical protein